MGDNDAPTSPPPSPPPPVEPTPTTEEVEANATEEVTDTAPKSSQDAPDEAADASASSSPTAETGEDETPAVPKPDDEPVPQPATVDRASPATTSTPASAPPTPPSKPTAPAPRRPKPPTRGILKPPPPPVKPSLGNRLRDMVSGVTGEVPGPSSRHGSDAMNAAVGTLNAISGRLFNRFGMKEEAPSQQRHQSRVPHVPGSRTPTFSMDQPIPVQGAQPQPADRHNLPLKRATFILPSISITYPISAQNEPWSAKVLEEREKVESRQRTLLSTASGGEYWTSIRLIKLYESACRGREEKPRLGVIRALQALPAAPKPRIVHLVLHDGPSASYPAPYPVEAPLKRYAAEALADLLTVEWSLTDLRLERGVIESEDALKPILHALLVSGTLPSFSLAGNKKIKAAGWRLVSVFLKRARSLRFMDLSETVWDRKGIEYLVQALNVSTTGVNGTSDPDTPNDGASEDDGENESNQDVHRPFLPPAPLLRETDGNNLPPAVETLRMDNCGLRSTTLETLANGVRTASLKHISLRQNRISPLGAVSLAVMIRDYPDTSSAVTALSQLSSVSNSASASETSLYTPYTPRTRRGAPPTSQSDDSNLPPIPLVSSSATGGVTSRVLPEGYRPPPPPKYPLVMPGGGYSAMQDSGSATLGPDDKTSAAAQEYNITSLALQRRVRALDGVERIGHLLTLDLKGNDIGKGVTYIAQVLKRNRTLKVLNLSENKIDTTGLVSLAESLKYNSTLETLDVSSNPCAGPGLESISALRMSFTVNNSLKRLFLMDTGLTTEGAIDLAEFIPENRALLHLDVTQNPAIGTAGILALSSGLKSNRNIRCLDVSIPPNDPNLAELSQSILQLCIRNTELAATTLNKPAGAVTEALWRPIKKSTLVRQVKEADAARAQKEREQVARSVQGQAREYVYRVKPDDLVSVAQDTCKGLEAWYAASTAARTHPTSAWEGIQMPKEDFRALIERARALTERIAESVDAIPNAEQLETLLTLNDSLTGHINNAPGFVQPPRILLPSQIAFATPAAPVVTTVQTGSALTPRSRRHQRSTSLEILSPNFSIGDSDAESDAEELDSSTIATPPTLSRQDQNKPTPPSINIETDGAANAEEPRTPSPRSIDAATAAERLVDAELAQGLELASSPVERASRKWVEEEAEIFRKGTRLGVINSDSEDDESDGHGSKREELTGEQLRQEIMETEVPRSPPRTVVELDDVDDDDAPATPVGN